MAAIESPRGVSLQSLAVGLALQLLLSTNAAPPAAPTPDEPPLFGEEIDVRVVNVEAVVTDHSGNRVSGLKPEDFRLKVDGREVPVGFFSEVREGDAVSAPEAGAAPAGPAGVSAGEPVGTSYLVFVDDFFATAIRRNEVLTAFKKDLGHLGPKDTMAVVAFDGARLTRLSGWTGSAEELGKVFDQASKRPAHGLERGTELRTLQSSQDLSDMATQDGDPQHVISAQSSAQSPSQATPPDPTDLMGSRMGHSGLSLQQRAYGEVLIEQLKTSVSAVVSAMRGSGAPNGRKVVLLLSGGWPFSVQSFIESSAQGLPSHELKDGELIYRPLTSTANLLGFTIYPVDVPGIETGAADASSFGASPAGLNLREQENEGSLNFIAEETGGRALINSARLGALTTAATDVRSYYWLGFTPTWERNDKRHKIDVTVLKPGLKVRSRNNFLDLSRQAEVSMRVESALLLGNVPGAVPMPIRLGTPVKNDKNKTVEIPITLGLPVSILTVIEQSGKFRSHVELRAVAADKNGNRSEVPVVPVDLSSGKAPKPGGFVKYETRLAIKGSASHVVLAIYDVASGKIATAESDVTTP